MAKYNVKDPDLEKYGIVYTPNNLVNKVLDLIPEENFKKPDFKWLDIGAGKGAFTFNLFDRLYKNLDGIFIDPYERKKHILENMLYMVEIYEPHIVELKNKFKEICDISLNLITGDFLSINKHEYPYFDFIIGNPPYNIDGSIKTPTNNNKDKKDDGKTIYVDFISKSLEMLHEDGYLNLIIPNLWLKPDKAGLYKTLTNLNIIKLNCLSTSESSKLFNYQAQIPTSYFLIQNRDISFYNNKIINLYDKNVNNYVKYTLLNNYPIPTHSATIINKLMEYVKTYGSLKIHKTNTAPTNSKFSVYCINAHEKYDYINIKTCYIDENSPTLIFNYSNIKQSYYKTPKLVLPHKMYGFPYFDETGVYGVSARDNYVITKNDYSLSELESLQYYLSSKFALFIFSVTNYRMRLLEKYAFHFIPDITKISYFPSLKNTSQKERSILIADFFKLSESERDFIENSIKDYEFFV